MTVDYATEDGTATQPDDYQQKEDTLTFEANQTTATVTVPVSGDTTDEPDESFFVNLSNPTNATISDAQGTGTITNDDQDTQAPQTDIALDPPTPNGENDWYTKTVNATISASDDSGSGVAETRCVLDPASPPDSFDDLPSSPCPYLGSGASVSSEGQHTLYAASKDEAGNKETLQSTSFKIDTSAPTISDLGPTTQPNANGWYNTDVTNRFEASDPGSVLDDACQTAFSDQAGQNVQSKTTSGEGSQVTVTSDSCTDVAGNTATGEDSATFKIDKSKPNAPLASAGPADYTDQNGDKWYKDSATVIFSANDDPPLADGSDGSGVQSVSDPATRNTSGVLDYSGTATDNAGNQSDATSGSVNVDAEAPTSSASAKDSDNNDYNSGNWTNKDVTVTLSADDGQGSGVKHIAYSVNGNADTAAGSSKQITVSDEGTTTITFHAVDNGGKEDAQEHTFTVKLDKTAPTISDLRATTSPNGAGWYNTDVTNRFKASDSGSGLSTACQTNFPLSAGENIQSKTTSGEGSALKVTSDSCTDVAGNTATGEDSATFKIDKTAPSVSETIPKANATKVSRTTPVTAKFSEAVQADTLTSDTVQLFSGNSTKPVKATLSKTSNSVTLTPSTRLDANKRYTAKIEGGATGVKDLADNTLSDFSWTFTRGGR